MKAMMLGELARRGINAGPPEMWYSNLTQVGNIGCASIFVILDDMLTQGLIKDGDTLLCMIPESGRFIISYMHLTAVTTATTPKTQP
jgi:3-oxoacyl-[acyl-carrier-protein] synthase-3